MLELFEIDLKQFKALMSYLGTNGDHENYHSWKQNHLEKVTVQSPNQSLESDLLASTRSAKILL